MVQLSATLSVLGGSSVSTPLLIESLAAAVDRGEIPPLNVRLYGRAAARMEGVAAHGLHRATRYPGARLAVSAHTDLKAALHGADLVLCQVRPGGFLGRAADEQLALREGIPGDEGLGPSGLACYLRGRPALDRLAEQVALHAPRARYLQLTSPLSLTVARARQHAGVDCYGVCELVGNTARLVFEVAEAAVAPGPWTARWAGLNHQNWIHQLLDAEGRDRTGEVLAALHDPRMVRVDPEIIRREGAVPVPYLRLYYHTAREVAAQRARAEPRGAELEGWATRLEEAYLGRGPDHAALEALLGERHVNWYDEGVAPAIAAFLADQPARISLNLPGAGGLAGVDPQAVIELPCQVSRHGVAVESVPPLPPGPAALTARLMAYEAAVLALAPQPDAAALAEALALHPLVPDEATAARLGAALAA